MLVLDEPFAEDGGGCFEVVAEFDEQIDVVEVGLTTEAVGEVVARVERGLQFAALRAEEAEIPFNLLGGWTMLAELADGHVHRQIVADRTE